jgi:hypothetical protein
VVYWLALKTTNTEVPGSIPGHSLGFFWGSWVWNGVHSASSSYLTKEVSVRFRKLKMQLWDSMCWPHVNPVPSGAVGKDCQRRLLSRPRFVRACSATDLFYLIAITLLESIINDFVRVRCSFYYTQYIRKPAVYSTHKPFFTIRYGHSLIL